MEYKTDNNNDLRAWLYCLLAEMEQKPVIEATRTISTGGKIVLEITFGSNK